MPDRPVVLLTGRTGQVGGELLTALDPIARVVAPSRSELDMANPDAIRRAVRETRPTVVVNAAAYTAVERAEQDAELCARINADAPGILAEESAGIGALIIHYSTDYVFDGTKGSPYIESDAPSPLNVYGRTKLDGERAVAGSGARHLILRTSWVYGSRGSNFLRTMLRLAEHRDEVSVVDDQTGTPTWCRSIPRATAQLLPRLSDSNADDASGVFHLASAGSATWCSFAAAIFADLARGGTTREVRARPISTSEFPSAVRRPSYSVLDCSRLREQFGVAIPDWREDLQSVLADIAIERAS
jgi:dTDP-4-dehydrorhamnose reductase